MAGHYGKAALFAAGLAIVMLVVHLAVPFGVLDHGTEANDLGVDDDSVTRGDIADNEKQAEELGFDVYGPASVKLTLAGTILALIGGLGVLLLGWTPLSVGLARFAGWGAGFIAALGGWFVFTSSLYPVGTGFATLLDVISGNSDDFARLWVISPVVLTILSGAFLFFITSIMAGVVTQGSGLRAEARKTLRAPMLAALLLVAVLVMPWAISIRDGDQRIEADECRGDCEGRVDWFTAGGSSFGPGIVDTNEFSTETGEPWWGHLAFSIKVITAAAWIAFFIGLLASLGPVVASATSLQWADKTVNLQVLNLPMIAWAAVQLILAFSYQWRPSWNEDIIADGSGWWFGWFPLVAIAPLAMWAIAQWHVSSGLFAGTKEFLANRETESHSFD